MTVLATKYKNNTDFPNLLKKKDYSRLYRSAI